MVRSRLIPFALLLLPLTLAIGVAPSAAPSTANTDALAPTEVQAATARLLQGLFSDGQYAYRPRPLDDALSVDLFRRYLDSLDAQKLFFDERDLRRFEPYRTTLDDAIAGEALTPPYEIFRTYAQRVDERSAYARGLLANEFDFTTDDTWTFDREHAPWAADRASLDALWRKLVKNDVLRLKLAGRAPADIRRTLDKRYQRMAQSVHELRDDDVFELFMNAYAATIDPHTGYMGPRRAEDFNIGMRLSMEGIGAVMQRDDEFVVIRSLSPGGPAATSGELKVGDRVVAVGQAGTLPMTDVVGWRLDDVIDLVRGRKGTSVRLDILPVDAGADAVPRRVTLVREQIRIEQQAAKQSIVQAGKMRIGVIDLPMFYLDFEALRRGDPKARSATADVASLLQQLKAERVDGVIVDLRGNGGGSLLEAIELSGLFIDQGPAVQVRENGRVAVESDTRPGVAWDGPLAVMVDHASASSSEIFAAAMQDYGRGLVIGERTFGKGTVQNLIDLDRWHGDATPLYGQVKLTTAQFFRIDGRTTQHDGVTPDIALPGSGLAAEIGESHYDNALPASRIAPVRHPRLGDFSALLPRLQHRHSQRIADDADFRWRAQDLARFTADQARREVSLNEDQRRQQRDRDEAHRRQRQAERLARGRPGDVRDDDDGLASGDLGVVEQVAREQRAEATRTDPLLREGALILADAMQLLADEPALAAQALPQTGRPRTWVN